MGVSTRLEEERGEPSSMSASEASTSPLLRFNGSRGLVRGLFLSAGVIPSLMAVTAVTAVESASARGFIVFYVAPFFVALFVWAGLRVGERSRRSLGALALDALVVSVAAIRFLTATLPISGHMLFFVYSGATTPVAAYRVLVLLLAVETT